MTKRDGCSQANHEKKAHVEASQAKDPAQREVKLPNIGTHVHTIVRLLSRCFASKARHVLFYML